mgnify:CR=1 FL=1
MESIRRRTFEVLDAGRDDTGLGRIVDLVLIAMISLNVIAVVFESMHSVEAEYRDFFSAFEVFSVVVFAAEYVTRVWSCVEHDSVKFSRPFWGRLRYMVTPMAILDLIVILPLFVIFFVDVDLRVLRILRVLRLFRVFRLIRFSSSMGLLIQVFKEEGSNIGAALFILLLLTLLAASSIYLVEAHVQPDNFGSIPQALWWAIITMTTIGDVVPVTVVGKFLGAIIGILSMGMVALPAGLLASGFNQAVHRRRDEYEGLVDRVLADGHIDKDEHEELQLARDLLALSDAEAASVLRAAHAKRGHGGLQNCPHCGEPVFLHRRAADRGN